MIELLVKGLGVPTRHRLAAKRLILGRSMENDLALDSPTVSRRHAELRLQGGNLMVINHSSQGLLVNGHHVEGSRPAPPEGIIQLGKVTIQYQLTRPERSGAEEAKKQSQEQADGSCPDSIQLPLVPPELFADLHLSLIERFDLRDPAIMAMDDSNRKAHARELLGELIPHFMDRFPPGLDTGGLIQMLLDEALGLGPLENLLADEEVSEIMVIHKDLVFAERGGRLTQAPCRFSSDEALLAVIERIVTPLGRRIDESSPLVDARLKDGSRVNAIIPPLALRGPCLTIRKFGKNRLSIDSLVGFGALDERMATFLRAVVKAGKNIVISGGTGSGKTTLLNVLSGFIPEEERVVTIEDAAELDLHQEHVVSLETRPPNMEGRGEISMRRLVKNALRMRPDRIVVGECRGGEALDMLQAMNTGHDGSLTTAHANTPKDMITRLETMVLMAGVELPVRAVRSQIASAVDLIVQARRFEDGSRKITHITEVCGVEEDGEVYLEDIFRFERESSLAGEKVAGGHLATGYIPSCMALLITRGLMSEGQLFSTEVIS